jgi:hypothetical protein
MSRLSRIAGIVSALVLIGLLDSADGTRLALAADLPLIPRHSPTHHSGAPASHVDADWRLEGFAKGPNASCTAWTDGCRACGNGPDGIHCSNIGIACQPSEPHCTRP